MIDIIDWFCLINAKNISIKTFWSLIQIYKTAKEALKHVEVNISKTMAEKILENFDGKIITPYDEYFPDELKATATCPPIIFAKGNLQLLKKQKIAIIGARNASITGKSIAFNIASDLSRDFPIVSGLAHGIDTSAHIGALKNGTTIAILPFSFNNIFPKENADLLEQIIQKGIAITEISPLMQPDQSMFHKRNRLLSAISSAVVIIEAAQKSGTLSTALLDIKKALVIPGSPADLRYKGSNYLIKRGAKLVEDANDIKNHLKKPIINTIIKETTKLNSIEENIIQIIKEEKQINIDTLADKLQIDMQTLLQNISKLEILGKIKKIALNDVVLNA